MTVDSKSWRKASALVPLAALSASWTVVLAVSGADAFGSSPNGVPEGLAGAEAFEVPASVSSPGEIAPAVPATSSRRAIVSSSSTSGIPAAALAAYQRAAQVVDSVDTGCNVDWPLIAAIGRVESDHGRYAGNVLSPEGVAKPGIYGIALDGSNGTQRIEDTDAAEFDGDPRFDRAVGPMQFIPSTWTVVGVDADGDGKRNPQDIDDAALATAVYLCSGSESLATAAGVTSAVFRYNHSQRYVNMVRTIATKYSEGEFSRVPTAAYAPVTFAAVPGPQPRHQPPRAVHPSAKGSLAESTGSPVKPSTPPIPADAEKAAAPKKAKDPIGDLIKNLPQTLNDTLQVTGADKFLGGLGLGSVIGALAP